MCMMMKAAPRSASSGHIASSPRPPVTSFTIFAPASKAAAATSAFEVSIESKVSPASSSIIGITRRFSSATSTGSAPGRVDSPPTSMMLAPLAIIFRASASACGAGKNLPPSENESGVTFRTPMIQPRVERSKISPAIFHGVTPI